MNQRDSTERRSLRSQASEMDVEAKSTGMQAIPRNCKKKKKKRQGNGFFLPLKHLGGVQPCGHLAQWDSFQISDFQHCENVLL